MIIVYCKYYRVLINQLYFTERNLKYERRKTTNRLPNPYHLLFDYKYITHEWYKVFDMIKDLFVINYKSERWY